MAPDIDDLLFRRVPMPPYEGPKLKAFRHFGKRIEFLRLLSCDPRLEESEYGHGYVFDVRIGKERFALKMFKFYDILEARYEYPAITRMRVSDEMLTFHSDPFFAECRAYGRINQYYEDLEAKIRRRPRGRRPGPGNIEIKPIAVPCYGYMTLSAEYENMLCKRFKVDDWNRSFEEDTGEAPKRPFRALVKKLIRSRVSVSNPRRMLANLKQLRKLGIYARDIYARNYKAGLLVDFSVAWTEPHWSSFAKGAWQLKCARNTELSLFDDMIEDENIKTIVRATQNLDYCEKLRSFDATGTEDFDEIFGPNWRGNHQEDPEENSRENSIEDSREDAREDAREDSREDSKEYLREEPIEYLGEDPTEYLREDSREQAPHPF
ncbi:hypothetical protein SAMD00023353_2201020 [Rosellinia necatrix]|uniref:Uncharacterized protein n=1 Tax=Rosellinia necatrix TaxID=77044 RepID=A0A1S7UNZ0_ROSNE|nr:hypothetical protein SAMD00023353_2201020 [Rosellinia necatrix]